MPQSNPPIRGNPYPRAIGAAVNHGVAHGAEIWSRDLKWAIVKTQGPYDSAHASYLSGFRVKERPLQNWPRSGTRAPAWGPGVPTGSVGTRPLAILCCPFRRLKPHAVFSRAQWESEGRLPWLNPFPSRFPGGQ